MIIVVDLIGSKVIFISLIAPELLTDKHDDQQIETAAKPQKAVPFDYRYYNQRR